MNATNYGRRKILQGGAAAFALSSFPVLKAIGQTSLATRVEWQTFKTTPNYTSFVNAIGAMRNNTNAADPASMQYWANIHKNFCPHNVSYFLAWHRGFVYHFERQLRTVSGNSSLVLPYWNYYLYSTIPAEFSTPGSDNPLYTDRLTNDVYSALSMTPFGSTLVNFPRGMSYAFEPPIEYKPHGAFHNLIGNVMATMLSPLDPIFWMHHTQMDRLWVSWLNQGGGRKMPVSTDPYWSGSFSYGTLTLPRLQTYDTRTYLGYRYDNETAPAKLPVKPATASIAAMATMDSAGRTAVPPRPAVGNFTRSLPRTIGNGQRSVGGATNIGLNENSVSVQIPLAAQDVAALQSLLAKVQPSETDTGATATSYRSVQIVLDNVRTTGTGAKGGYYFNVYLNLPAGGDSAASENQYLLGGLGPFEIDGALHHHGHGQAAGQLAYAATLQLRSLLPRDTKNAFISFVRVNGDNPPRGQVITIGEARMELTTQGA